MKHGDLSQRIPEIGTNEISSLSHDLRTPLTAIISYLEFIEQTNYESEDKREEYIHIVH